MARRCCFSKKCRAIGISRGARRGSTRQDTSKRRAEITEETQRLLRLSAWNIFNVPGVADRVRSLQAERERLHEQQNTGVPDAPFSKNWHELSFKRMLRWAAENGYDRLDGPAGEQQAERYDLSKHINTLTYNNDHSLVAYDKQDNEVMRKKVSSGRIGGSYWQRGRSEITGTKTNVWGAIRNKATLRRRSQDRRRGHEGFLQTRSYRTSPTSTPRSGEPRWGRAASRVHPKVG